MVPDHKILVNSLDSISVFPGLGIQISGSSTIHLVKDIKKVYLVETVAGLQHTHHLALHLSDDTLIALFPVHTIYLCTPGVVCGEP